MTVIIREKENYTEVSGLTTGLMYRVTREGNKLEVKEVFTPDSIDATVTVYENLSTNTFYPRTNGGGVLTTEKANKLVYDLQEVIEMCEVLNNL